MAVTMGKGEFKAYMCNVIDHIDDGSPLRPSVQAELMAKLSPDVRAAVMDMEGANA